MNKALRVRILLVEIINRNLGDSVIGDNTRYLINKAMPGKYQEQYEIIPYNFYMEDYEMVSHADCIVFDGGGIIKYKREKFYQYVADILECANTHDIPVFFCGVGVEGYDDQDERCRLLKEKLQYPCIKGITIRDDIETFLQYYAEEIKAPVEKVCDPAVYTDEVYGIEAEPGADTIGLGIARYKLFEDHDMPEIDRAFQLNMWKEVTQKLEERGYKWKLFVNGLKSDYDFALEVLEFLGHSDEREKYLEPRPVDSVELVETIASYKAIVAYRMHANIIAYALKIPSIGLVWNDKLKFWGESIGYPERFLTQDSFNGKAIADGLCKAMEQGVKHKSRAFKKSVYKPLKRFLKSYALPLTKKLYKEAVPVSDTAEANFDTGWNTKRPDTVEKLNWQNHLVATALGGLEMQYCNMNTPLMVKESLKNEFIYLEADVRITSDNRLVCVNGWTEDTYNKLNLSFKDRENKLMSYEEFMKCKYYDGHYSVLNTELLMNILRYKNNWRLILDIGIPPKATRETFAREIEKFFDGEKMLYENCIIRVQTKADVEVFRKLKHDFNLMYFCPDANEREKKAIGLPDIEKYCKENKISWISFTKQGFDAEAAKVFKKAEINMCVFSYGTAGEIRNAVDMGADLVGTHYMNPRELNTLQI